VGRLRVIAFAVLATCACLGGGCKATPPGKMETAIVTRAKHWVTVGNRSEKNPLRPTAENIAEGKTNFSHYCVACHGLDGQNTGVPFADTMSPPIPSLSSADVQSYSDGQLKSIIDGGIFPSGMPASKGILTDEEIWGTVLYIRHLPAAGSLGEPAMYDGDAGQKTGSSDDIGTTPSERSKNSTTSTQLQPR
jgi:mono/diheme cytochrome c family protein